MDAKRRAFGLLVVAGLIASFAPGCVYKPVQIGGPMFGSEELKGRRLVKLAEGKTCSSHVLYAIPVGDDSMQTALERLTKKAAWSPDVVTVEQGQMFWLFGWSNCTRITGYGAVVSATKFKTTILSAEPAPDAAGKPLPEETPE